MDLWEGGMDKAEQSQFDITQVLEIRDRGVVLAGQLRSGAVEPGMQINFTHNTGLKIVATVKSVDSSTVPPATPKWA